MNRFPRAAALLAALLAVPTAFAASPADLFHIVPVDPDPKAGELPVTEADLKKREAAAGGGLTLRPNSTSAVWVYAKNPTGNPKTVMVELLAGKQVAGVGTAVLPAGGWARVKFAKPAPPPVQPAPPVAAAPAGTVPVAKPEPPPPGAPLPRSAAGFAFTLRLRNANGGDLTDEKGKPLTDEGQPLELKVPLALPDAYLEVRSSAAADRGVVDVSAAVAVRADDDVPAGVRLSYPGPLTAKLSFTAPKDSAPPVLRDGVYVRTLDLAAGKAAALAGSAVVPGEADETATVYLSLDGVERAVIYQKKRLSELPRPVPGEQGAKLNRDVKAVAVRVYPSDAARSSAVTRPSAAFPVRIETDNADPAWSLRVSVRRAGNADAAEVVPLGRRGEPTGPRDERVWVDAADTGLSFVTASKDWVKPLDLGDTHGRVEVVAELVRKGGKDGKEDVVESSGTLAVTVDAYPPTGIDLRLGGTDAPTEAWVKGKPLPVRAAAADADSGVARAVFVFGKFQVDGTFADPVLVEGVRETRVDARTRRVEETGYWTAELPLPADKRGEVQVGVAFTDGAGNATKPTKADVKTLLLKDAPPPTGTIEGRVLVGDRPQPGLTVTLVGADAKAKKTATTDDNGKFTFKEVPVGSYAVAAAKTDSNTGSSAAADLAVEADKIAKPVLSLKKTIVR